MSKKNRGLPDTKGQGPKEAVNNPEPATPASEFPEAAPPEGPAAGVAPELGRDAGHDPGKVEAPHPSEEDLEVQRAEGEGMPPARTSGGAAGASPEPPPDREFDPEPVTGEPPPQEEAPAAVGDTEDIGWQPGDPEDTENIGREPARDPDEAARAADAIEGDDWEPPPHDPVAMSLATEAGTVLARAGIDLENPNWQFVLRLIVGLAGLFRKHSSPARGLALLGGAAGGDANRDNEVHGGVSSLLYDAAAIIRPAPSTAHATAVARGSRRPPEGGTSAEGLQSPKNQPRGKK